MSDNEKITTTIRVPKILHEVLREMSYKTGKSINEIMVSQIEQITIQKKESK